MSRRSALPTEILRRADQRAAKEIGPQSINEYTGSERMPRIGEPMSQPQAISWRIGRKWNENVRERIAVDTIGIGLRRVVSTTGKDVRRPRLSQLRHHRNLL